MSERDPGWWAAELRKGWSGDPWHGPATRGLIQEVGAAAAAAHPAAAALGESLEELARAVESLPPAGLDRRVGTLGDRSLGTGVSCREMIHGLVQHNAYHSGQIALLRKALAGQRGSG
jgi:hypothetical protein